MSRRPRPRPVPVSKVCHLVGDAPHLEGVYRIIDCYPDVLAGQHPIRRWEYAMALRAIQVWAQDYWATHPTATDRDAPRVICDVGGASSNFWQVLTSLTSEDIVVVDSSMPPTGPFPVGQVAYVPGTIEAYAACTRHNRFDVLTCLSVIEHVEHLRPFFRACHMLLKPGGLLMLTTDFWDAEGEDVAHFHWMRQRIYNAERIKRLLECLRELGFRSFGVADWTYAGAQVYDYAVASLAVVRV